MNLNPKKLLLSQIQARYDYLLARLKSENHKEWLYLHEYWELEELGFLLAKEPIHLDFD